MPKKYSTLRKFTGSLMSFTAAWLALHLALAQSASVPISDRNLRASSIDGHRGKVTGLARIGLPRMFAFPI
jgi:hypothetical protein